MAIEKKLKDPAEAALSAIEQALNLDALTPTNTDGRAEPRLPDVGDAEPLLDGGLDAAGRTMPPRLDLDPPLASDLPPEPAVEAALYFTTAEALANVARYARASCATVRISTAGGEAAVEVADDGVGGADPRRGSGLRGLIDRVSALDGRLEIDSPPGAGTRLRAVVPLTRAPTLAPGFPGRAELAERYAARSGRDISGLDFFVALAYWKTAAILEGVFARYSAGQYGETSDEYTSFGEIVEQLAGAAHDAARRLE